MLCHKGTWLILYINKIMCGVKEFILKDDLTHKGIILNKTA